MTLNDVIIKAGLVGLLAMPLTSCERDIPGNEYGNESPCVKVEKIIIQNPEYEDFRTVLGEKRLAGMTKENESRLKKFWDDLQQPMKDSIYLSFANPDKILSQFSKNERTDYDNFDTDPLENDSPWKPIRCEGRISDSDKTAYMLIDTRNKLAKSFRF
jgi:hypothetical protein